MNLDGQPLADDFGHRCDYKRTNIDLLPREESLQAIGALIDEWENTYSSGGSLHIVTDDGNVEREHIEFCETYASERGDVAGVALAKLLLMLSEDEVRVVTGWSKES